MVIIINRRLKWSAATIRLLTSEYEVVRYWAPVASAGACRDGDGLCAPLVGKLRDSATREPRPSLDH